MCLNEVLNNAGKALRDLLQGGKPEFALTWELPLALLGWVGAVAQDLRTRRIGLGSVGIAVWVFSLFAGAQVGVSQWRGERYQASTFFLMTLGVALLIGFVAAQLPRLRTDIALPLALILAFAPNLPRWRDTFCNDALVIRNKQVAAAHFVRDRLPRDARVFVCDAGALGFLAERWTYDAVGLTTPMRGNSYIAGPGSRFEELEHWPREKWPNYAAIYSWCAWAGVQGQTLSQNLDLRVQEFLDTGLGTGDRPTLDHAGTLADALDVADLTSEEAHGWRESGGGARDRNVVGRGKYVGRPESIADGVRVVQGRVEFVLRGNPGATALLVARTQGGAAMAAIVNGRRFDIPAAQQAEWIEPELGLGVLAQRELRVQLELQPGARLPLGHVWLYEQSAPPAK
jgi:hypothetical protein